MSDGISIGIGVDYNGSAGVNAAIADVNRIAAAATSAASKLGGTVGRVDPYRNAAAEMQALSNQYYSQAKGADKAKASLDKYSASQKAMMSFVGTYFTAQTVKQTYNLARLGAEVQYTALKFDRLSKTVGSTGNAFLNDLRAATKGTISDFAAMKQGSDLLQLGLAGSKEEAIRLSRVMTALGMDTGELTLALANQSKRRLDQLGLSLTKFNEIERKLKDQGMNKQDAFKEAFIQTAEQTVVTTGNMADTPLGDYMRLEAQMQNMKQQAGLLLSNMPVKGWSGVSLQKGIGQVANTIRYINGIMNGELVNAGGFRWDNENKQFSWNVKQRSEQEMALAKNPLWSEVSRRPYAQNYPMIGRSGFQNYTAMAYAAQAGGGAGLQTGVERTAEEYADLLDGALKITKQTEKFAEATKELNKQFVVEQGNLAAIIREYGVASDKAQEQREKIEGIRKDQAEVGAAKTEMGGASVLGAMTDPQKQLDFAMAMGMITEEAYTAQSAFLDIAKVLDTTTNSANAAALATKAIAGNVRGLDGSRYTMYVDVIVNWIGGVALFGGAKGLNRQNQAAVHNCFSAGTMILMADGTTTPIQDVKTGDWVTSYDTATGQNIRAQVVDAYHHPVETMGEYYLIINNHINVTPNHPLWVNGGWQEAGALKVGDILHGVDGDVAVFSIIQVYHQIETFNLHINDENHNYFADGILAHNKAEGGRVFAPGDGSKDTVLVPLANGEYVVNARDASRHMSLLEAINDGRLMNGMAVGGEVDGGVARSGGRVGGRTATTSSARSSARIGLSYDSSGVLGGGSDSLGAIIPEITDAVSGTVAQTIAQSAQMQALESSLAEQRKQVDILMALLEKTASANDIGRAVKHSVYTQA